MGRQFGKRGGLEYGFNGSAMGEGETMGSASQHGERGQAEQAGFGWEVPEQIRNKAINLATGDQLLCFYLCLGCRLELIQELGQRGG